MPVLPGVGGGGLRMPRSLCTGPMDKGPQTQTHQLSENVSSLEQPESLSVPSDRQECPDSIRQYLSSALLKQTRGYTINPTVFPHLEGSIVVPKAQHYSESSPLGRGEECFGRQTFPTEDITSRVESPLRSDKNTVPSAGSAPH